MLAVLGVVFGWIIFCFVVGTLADNARGRGHRNYDHPDMLGSGDDDF